MDIKKYKVTICCIVYNHENFLKDCFNGFEKQEVDFDVEIVIHDDCSTDKSRQLIEDYKINSKFDIKTIYPKENRYTKDKFNFISGMFTYSKGKYIAMCEGDDYWTDPLKLQKQVDFLEKEKKANGCFHDANFVNKNGEIIDEKYNLGNFTSKFYNQKQCFESLKSSYATCSLVFRSDVFKDGHHLLFENICDEFLDLLITEKGLLYFLKFDGAAYRFHEGGVWSGTSTFKKRIMEYDRAKVLYKIPSFKNKYKKTLETRVFSSAKGFLFSNAVTRKVRGVYFIKLLKYLDFSKKETYDFVLKFLMSFLLGRKIKIN